MNIIPERDWKKIRVMKDGILTVACDRIIIKIEKLMKNKRFTSHEKYLNLWKLMRAEDEEIAIMFDDLKRSNAMSKLASWRRNDLLTEEMFEQFSDATKKTITVWSGIDR